MSSTKGSMDRLSQAMQLIAAKQSNGRWNGAAATTGRGDGTAINNDGNAGKRSVAILQRLRERYRMLEGDDLPAGVKNEYRRIKRPLLANAFGKSASLVDQGNLIMVTSSVPGEGKTYSSINLALTLAKEQDHTVLLVDCDVTRRGTSRTLGIEAQSPDITDLLMDSSVSVGDTLLKTEIPNLVVLPAGRSHETITELMASHRMARLTKEVANRYKDRIVIFDGPPMLSTPETQVLAGLVGQVVFVIEANKTPRGVIADALENIPEDKSIGLLLNKSESITNRGGYYYNYYRSYGEADASADGP